MDISSVGSISGINGLTSGLTAGKESSGTNRNEAFETLFQSALSMVNETNEYTQAAQEEEMAYAMGLTNSTHDLQIAQSKASISLQYTVAVRNAVLDAYKEIMQLQF